MERRLGACSCAGFPHDTQRLQPCDALGGKRVLLLGLSLGAQPRPQRRVLGIVIRHIAVPLTGFERLQRFELRLPRRIQRVPHDAQRLHLPSVHGMSVDAVSRVRRRSAPHTFAEQPASLPPSRHLARGTGEDDGEARGSNDEADKGVRQHPCTERDQDSGAVGRWGGLYSATDAGSRAAVVRRMSRGPARGGG